MKTFAALALISSLLATMPGQDGQDAARPKPERTRVETLSKELDGGTGGLEVDAKGFIYCSDFGSKLGAGSVGGDKVFRLDPSTGAATIFVNGLRGASGNAIGPGGDFFQSNIGAGTITRVKPDGTSTRFASGFTQPVGLAIDPEGNLYVAGCGDNSIAEVSPDGKWTVFASSPLLKCPNGIVLDDEHNLYVCNFGNGDVLKIDWMGQVTKLVTLPGNNNGHLVYRDGVLYVIARSAHQIYRVTLDGKAELFAGSGKRGHDNGPALEATFSFPNDLAFSPDGKFLYINENAPLDEPGTTLAPMLVRRIRMGE